MEETYEKGKEAIDLISKFYLNELDFEWVKDVINSDFTEAPKIPSQFEDVHASTNFGGLFNAVINTLRQYVDMIKQEPNIPEQKRASLTFLSTESLRDEQYEMSDVFTKFWISIASDINIKSLLAFLFYYIHKGQSYDSNEESRELGIHSSSIYFLLLSIPGSNAFRVFHPVLYLKALDILKLTTKLNVGASSPKKGGRGSRASQRKSSEDLVGDGNDDEDGEVSYLSPTEASKLIRSLNILLNDFLRLSLKFSLKHSTDSLDETISVLVEITRCEIHNAQGVFLHRHAANSVAALAYNSYVALQNLCESLHGNSKKTVIIIMKYIINNILMTPRGGSDLSTRALTVIKEHSVIFVKYLMIQLKGEASEGVYILVQHICFRVQDKAEIREKTAKAVVEILKVFPLKEYSQFINWLFKLSKHEKAGHRLFTLEVISKLLTEDERQTNLQEEVNESPGESSGNEEASVNNSVLSTAADASVSVPINKQVLSHKFLLCIVFSRCQDSAATVRSKALSLLAECTLSNNPTIIEAMKQMFSNKDAHILKPSEMTKEDDTDSDSEVSEDEFHLPNAEIIMSMLRRRAHDDKVMVRKSALQVMENLMKLKEEMVTVDYLKVLANHCRDPALLIRKQMVQALSAIVEAYPDSEAAIRTWVSGVLPLILDPEMKVQEKVVELIDYLIFRRMRRWDNLAMSSLEVLPWNLLDSITKISFHKFFNKGLMLWAKGEYQSRIQVINVARTHIGKRFNEQTWTFLSLALQYIEIRDPSFIADYFEKNLNSKEIGSYTLQQVLRALCHVIKHIPLERAMTIQNDLLAVINSLSANVELISPMIDIITLISYKSAADEEKGQKDVENWSSAILKSCDEYLKQALFPVVPYCLEKEEEEKFFRYLFTLGEVAQLCPSKVNKRLFLMMQSIIFHQNHSVQKGNNENVRRIPSTQTQSSQPPQLSFNPTRRLKTLAVVTLGKMCLQHEDQAKRIIPAMGKMLDTTTLPSMKINIIIVLSDMCVRYATLVDPLMPQVTACLRDPDVQVRKTTLTLLINLLQEDYLKLKGSFFYRILQCLCDEEEEIRSTVIFYMTERLLKRFPKIFLQHLIECIFHYNCYEEHESYNRFTQSRQEKELFSLAGDKFRDQRMMLYRFMLDHMMDDQRFATTQRLCQDVLGAVVDGRIRLTPSSLPMLEDTFMVLSSDEIKLAWLKSKPEDSDQPTDLSEQAEMAGIVIKKTLISQVVKRNVIENIVPILIALKHKLAENRSPLMKQLLLYLKEIMKDYKNEVKEILAGDKQLAKEIEFDLRKLEQDQSENESVQQEKARKDRLNREKRQSAMSEDSNAPSNKEDASSTSENVDGGRSDENKDSNYEADKIVDVPVPSSPLFRRKSNVSVLLKKALINSQKKAVRNKVHAADNDVNTDVDSTSELSKEPRSETPSREIVQKDSTTERVNVEDNRKESEEGQLPKEAQTSGEVEGAQKDEVERAQKDEVERAQKDPVAEKAQRIQIVEEIISTYNPKLRKKEIKVTALTTEKERQAEPSSEIRENLMRAISTPNQSQKIIRDITFVNRSQDISSISLTESETTDHSKKHKSADAESTLLLHFKSPEAYAKDEQFSRLRRASKKSLNFKKESPKKPETPKHTTKRRSAGFMESYNESESVVEDDSSYLSESVISKRKKGNKRK